jgi:hypothetical protein
MALASYSSWLGPALICLFGVLLLMKYVTTAKWGDSYRAYLVYGIVGLGLATVVMAVFGVLAILERDWFIVALMLVAVGAGLYGISLGALALREGDWTRWQLLPRLKKLFVDD